MKHTCCQCREEHDAKSMVAFGDDWVCEKCKPLYVQKLKEGVLSCRPFRLGCLLKGLISAILGVSVAFIIHSLFLLDIIGGPPRIMWWLFLVFPSTLLGGVMSVVVFLYLVKRIEKRQEKELENAPDEPETQ